MKVFTLKKAKVKGKDVVTVVEKDIEGKEVPDGFQKQGHFALKTNSWRGRFWQPGIDVYPEEIGGETPPADLFAPISERRKYELVGGSNPGHYALMAQFA